MPSITYYYDVPAVDFDGSTFFSLRLSNFPSGTFVSLFDGFAQSCKKKPDLFYLTS